MCNFSIKTLRSCHKMGKILMNFCTLCENFAKNIYTYPETDMSNILPFRQLLNEVDFCCEIKKLQFHAHISLNILYTQLQGDQQFLSIIFWVFSTSCVSVVKFHDPTLGIGKVFGQESTVVK